MSGNQTNVNWEIAYKGTYTFNGAVDRDLKYPDDNMSGLKAHTFGIGCLKCKSANPIEPCPNCAGTEFKFGIGQNGTIGIFCISCQSGFTNYTCLECGTKNPISQQTMIKVKKSGCFIATAAYGSRFAPEVIYLSLFRDEILSGYSFGRSFIKLYYKISPFIAQMIRNSDGLKFLTKYLLILPSIFCVKTFKKKINVKNK